MIKEFSNHPTSFIYGSYLKNLDLCDNLIKSFNTSSNTHPGATGGGIDTMVKKSTDLSLLDLSDIDLGKAYILELNEILTKYIDKFGYLNCLDKWEIDPNINLQHYKPGEGFYSLHAENTTFYQHQDQPYPPGSRVLVFMTYLNSVEDGGGTEFPYQNVITKAKKGLTLIWPAFWTHYHRGIPSLTENKYIITGWYSFARPKK